MLGVLFFTLIGHDCLQSVEDLDFKMFAKAQEKKQIADIEALKKELDVLQKLYEARINHEKSVIK